MKKTLYILILIIVIIFAFSSCENKEHFHEFSEWAITENASCTVEGIKERTCFCGETEIEKIEITPCDFVDEICTMCKNKKGTSEGLLIENTGYGYAVVIGIGSCADAEIIIPNYFEGIPVERIGSESFRKCQTITSVVMGDNVKFIDESSFEHCTNLISITISDSVFSIGDKAFQYCTSLVNIQTSNDNRFMVGDSAFQGCTSLAQLPLSNIISIGVSSFHGCTALPSTLYFPESFSGAIGDGAFAFCTSIETIVFSNGITKIGNNAFDYCTNLENIHFGESLHTIGTDAFPSSSLVEQYPILSNLKATYALSEAHWKGLVSNYGFIGKITYNQPKPDMP